MAMTKVTDLIVPEVMAQMVSAKVEKKIVVSPFAKIDNSLVGVPGDEITIPQYAYIGDAVDVAEGESVETTKLTLTTTKTKIKKVMKAVELTDEAVLSGYGNPVGETNNQLALAIASKVDADSILALYDAQKKIAINNKVSYNGIVDAIDLFKEETNCKKVMFVHPSQVTTLRKDSDFISSEKIKDGVIVKGEIGEISHARIVPTKRVMMNPETYVALHEEPSNWATAYTSYFTKSGSDYAAVTGDSAPDFTENTYYQKLAAGKYYINPIVVIEDEGEANDPDALPALEIFLKRDTNVETERQTLRRTTDISADKLYAVALANQSKVVNAYFKK